MLTREEMQAAWNKAKENNRKCDECPRHRFNDPWPLPKFNMPLRCVNCGGEMRLLAIGQYIRGFEAAGRSGNEIWPGWRVDDAAKKD